MRVSPFSTVLAALGLACAASAADLPPLELERKIELGKVSGRIDHFAIDRAGHRLFLAELGNGTVSVIDTSSGTVTHRITGFDEPQGVAYVAETDALFVANGGDGSVRVLRGDGFTQTSKIELKDDADNLRVDAASHLVYVGFGSGALASIDVKTLEKKSEMRLKAHPEGFQLDLSSTRAFVNVPDAREVAVIDRSAGRQVAAWSVPDARSNFPMAVRQGQVLVVFRNPARLVALDASDGSVKSNVQSCRDADDVFVDEKRQRIYVSCGEGVIDVFKLALPLVRIAQIKTILGARTAFYDAEMDRLFLAVRAAWGEPAAVWVFKPQ